MGVNVGLGERLGRRGEPLRVALIAETPWPAAGRGLETFSYGMYRIQSAILGSPLAEDVEIRVIEGAGWPPSRYVEAIEAFDPHLVGASCYLWSLPVLMEVARALRSPGRRSRPFVIGGPSARPAMLDLPHYAFTRRCVDAIVIGEGEAAFQEIVGAGAALLKDPASVLASVPGLAVPTAEGWRRTAIRAMTPNPSRFPSPYQLDLAPGRGVRGHFETFRGCPIACRFCEWGVDVHGRGVFDADYLLADFEAMRDLEVSSIYQVDAGVNLSKRAFDNLQRAEREVGLGAATHLTCEVYPTNVSDPLLQLLSDTHADVGIGLQSFDGEVLKLHQRPMREARVIEGIKRVAGAATRTNVEIILGLPGDSPEGFKQTLHRCLDLFPDCNLRVYATLVLPDGLMTRGLPEFDMDFDPVTLEMRSCLGWSERDFAETFAYVDRLAEELDVREFGPEHLTGRDDTETARFGRGWLFGPSYKQRSGDERPDLPEAIEVRSPLVDALSPLVEAASQGFWRILGVEVRPDEVIVNLGVALGEVRLHVAPSAEDQKAYVRRAGLAFAYRDPDALLGHGDAMAVLDAVIDALAGASGLIATAAFWDLEAPIEPAPAPRHVSAALSEASLVDLASRISTATTSAWRCVGAERRGHEVRVAIGAAGGRFELALAPPTTPAFRVAGDVAFSYLSTDFEDFERLDAVIEALAPIAARLLAEGTSPEEGAR